MSHRDARHIWAVVDMTQVFIRRDDCIVSVHNPLRLDNWSEPAPDVVLLRSDYPRDAYPSPDSTLTVIEVADTTLDRDRSVKLPLYARAGIPEYWIVDLKGEQIEVYREPSPSGYLAMRIYQRGQRLSPTFAPEMSLDIDAVLGPSGAPEE